jgi:hypothetical protein
MSLMTPCKTADELHAWIATYTGLHVPRRAVCCGHAAPFDYLRRSYFEPSVDQVVWAPRGGGKTSLAAVATLLDLLHKPGITVRILGGSLEQSLRMWEYLMGHLESFREDLGDKTKITTRKLQLENGATAAVLTQSQKSVRGLRVQKLRCDEVELFEAPIWEAAQLVTRSRRAGSVRVQRSIDVDDDRTATELENPLIHGTIEAFSTLHRPFGLMQTIIDQAEQRRTPVVRWCLLDVLERCPPERECASCPLFDECRGIAKTRCEGFFPIDDAIVMKSRVSEETWKNEMLCQRPSVRGRVFPMFDEAVHVRQPPFALDHACEWTLGVDFGFSAPFACLWVAQRDGLMYVVDELIEKEKPVYAHLETIASRPWPRVGQISCDPAGASRNDQTAKSNIDLLKERGFRVRSSASHIADGIELVRAALRTASGTTRLFIHPRCVQLIQALRSYRYKNEFSELPDKDGTSDHPIDALRYFFVNNVKTTAKARRY